MQSTRFARWSQIRLGLRLLQLPLARPFTKCSSPIPAHIQPHAEASRPGRSMNQPILLLLDFDGTLSHRDTMHLVAEVGYSHQQAEQRVPQPRPWTEIVDAYLADFRAHSTAYQPVTSQRTSLDQEAAWLNSLRPVEEASFQRAVNAGVFDNVTRSEMEEGGRQALRTGQVELRNGFDQLLANVQRHNSRFPHRQLPFRVLSVNWSAAFITGVLHQASEQQSAAGQITLDDHTVYANEIPSINDEAPLLSKSSHAPPTGRTPIRTSGDKLAVLQTLRQSARSSSNDDDDDITLVYVGDSSTDLECLLAADVGICIRDGTGAGSSSSQKDFADLCQRIGIDVFPLTVAGAKRPPVPPETRNKPLWSAKDLDEISQWLLLDQLRNTPPRDGPRPSSSRDPIS